MQYRVNRFAIKKIDEENKVVTFDPKKSGKITGSRFQAVLGEDKYQSEFRAACLISRIYSDYVETKYTKAGEAIEPIIRKYVKEHSNEFLKEKMSLSENEKVTVEEPVDKNDCGYDHFKFNPVFGGMVDGYIRVNGERRAVLEIKTARDKEKWVDNEGKINNVPDNYMLQASLYAQLAELDEIIFAVGFLEESDYDNPKKWIPNEGNFAIIHVIKKDISEEMETAATWYNKYIKRGITPEWTDADIEIIERFLTKTVDFVSGDFTDLVKRYIDSNDEILKSQIRERLAEMIGNSKVVVYSQGGFDFKLVKNDMGICEMSIEKSA